MINIVEILKEYSQMNCDQIFKEFESSKSGITSEEATKRLKKFGKNEILYHKSKPWYTQLFKAFINPFNLIILILAIVSVITDIIMAEGEASWRTIIVLTIMVLLGGLLKFFQEYKSNIASENLKLLIKTTSAVERNGNNIQEEDIKELVPGDIIHLSAGDMIPADIRLLATKDLFLSQSALTGESEPVEKISECKKIITDKITPSELENIGLLGTSVVSGSAIAIIISTGENTYLGSMKEMFMTTRVKTSFEKGIDDVSKLLIKFMCIMVPIVFIINILFKGNILESFLFSISIAVGLTPEMLPMIVTTNLAKGALSLSKKRTIVKKLEAIQNFGAMDILCTDKTGTLTLDRIVVQKHLNIDGEEDLGVLKYGYLNSYFQTGLKNLMDKAILERGNIEGLINLQNKYVKVDEIPFDFTRKRMSVILDSTDENGNKNLEVITKGAVEEILSVSKFAEINKTVVQLNAEIINKIMDMVDYLSSQGMRIIAISKKKLREEHVGNFKIEDENEMILIGYIGFLDPPKDDAKEAIQALEQYGLKIKILTGDNDVVTKKICKDVGLEVQNILLGNEMDKMSDQELQIAVEKTTVFAKLSPVQKSKIVKALQILGHTVGYMGDGINDSAALKQADVGISVDTAVDIAKESADIILLEKNLMVLEEGVIEGRKIFGNINKYIKMTASSNFGNMFSVLIASAFLPFLPMLPIQLLIQNLLYDFSQTSIPWDHMDKEYLVKPRKWESNDLKKFMLCIGPLSSVFDIATFILMWYIFKANNLGMQSLFQSGWFVEGLLTQVLIVHMIRTEKIPFIQSTASAPVLILTFLIITIGVVIPFSYFGKIIGFVELPGIYFLWLFIILIGYFTLTLIVKYFYIKKFKTWL
ncbi:MAG: magnesium-translocating P-type ATPase [Cetobacterium sp.]|uniref:magnesium-translocating P-type ATPase n=1 Tax=Cetobacterium sp. TaxID=2071632 RepID=UPI002FCABDC1